MGNGAFRYASAQELDGDAGLEVRRSMALLARQRPDITPMPHEACPSFASVPTIRTAATVTAADSSVRGGLNDCSLSDQWVLMTRSAQSTRRASVALARPIGRVRPITCDVRGRNSRWNSSPDYKRGIRSCRPAPRRAPTLSTDRTYDVVIWITTCRREASTRP